MKRGYSGPLSAPHKEENVKSRFELIYTRSPLKPSIKDILRLTRTEEGNKRRNNKRITADENKVQALNAFIGHNLI